MYSKLISGCWHISKIIVTVGLLAATVAYGLDLVDVINEETSLTAEPPCCTKSFLKQPEDKFILIVGTIDGTLKALDVANGGRQLWSLSTDDQPLLSSTLSFVHQGPNEPKLIPSIDGSLYLFYEKAQGEPISADKLLHSSIRVGSDVIAGGMHFRTFGINYETGKVRYVNDMTGSQHFPDADISGSKQFIIKRISRTIRGIDPSTGVERWNATVGEHELKFWNEAEELPYGSADSCTRCPIPDGSYQESEENSSRHIGEGVDQVLFQVVPSQGLVIAYASDGYGLEELWRQKLDSPVVQMWRFQQNQLTEESLFGDSHALLPDSRDSLLATNSLLYFGIYQNQQYIIPSPEERGHVLRDQIAQQSAVTTKDSGKIYLASTDDFENDPVWIASKECDPTEVTALMLSNQQYSQDKGWYLYKHRQTDPTVLLDPNYSRHSDGRRFVNHSSVKRRYGQFEVISLFDYWFSWQQTVWLLIVCCVSTAIVVRKIVKRRYIAKLEKERMGNALLRSRSSSECKPSVSVESQASFTEDSEYLTSASDYKSRFLTDFEPLRCLGKGGFGIVFESRNRVDDVSYAVKRVAVADRPNARIKVMREVKALAKLDHPGIVRYFQSWFESPPVGWQDQTDTRVLQQCGFLSNGSASLLDVSESHSDAIRQRNRSKTTSTKPSLPRGDSFLEENFAKIRTPPDGVGMDLTKDSWNRSDHSDTIDDLSESFTSPSAHAEPTKSCLVEADDSIIFVNSECGDEPGGSESPVVVPSEIAVDKSTTTSSSSRSKVSLRNKSKLNINNATLDKELQTPLTHVFLYIQMQLCQDLTLRHWLESNPQRDYMTMFDWFDQIVAAVEYVHDEGMIHRDLKPSNIFFALDGKMKVGDFGLVTDVLHEPVEFELDAAGDSNNSNPRQNLTDRVGTFLYMSPEQMNGKPYTHKIDIYSLGLIFFELLVSFSTQMERVTILQKLKSGEFPANFAAEKSEEVAFVKWLTAADSNQRPNCREIREDRLFAGLEPRLDPMASKRRARSISSRAVTSSTNNSSSVSDHSPSSELCQPVSA